MNREDVKKVGKNVMFTLRYYMASIFSDIYTPFRFYIFHLNYSRLSCDEAKKKQSKTTEMIASVTFIRQKCNMLIRIRISPQHMCVACDYRVYF